MAVVERAHERVAAIGPWRRAGINAAALVVVAAIAIPIVGWSEPVDGNYFAVGAQVIPVLLLAIVVERAGFLVVLPQMMQKLSMRISEAPGDLVELPQSRRREAERELDLAAARLRKLMLRLADLPAEEARAFAEVWVLAALAEGTAFLAIAADHQQSGLAVIVAIVIAVLMLRLLYDVTTRLRQLALVPMLTFGLAEFGVVVQGERPTPESGGERQSAESA